MTIRQFNNSTIWTRLEKLSSKWNTLFLLLVSFFFREGVLFVFSFLCLFLPKQPFMAPNPVPLDQSFNHQTNFSLSFFVPCKKLHTSFCSKAWLQQPGKKDPASLHLSSFWYGSGLSINMMLASIQAGGKTKAVCCFLSHTAGPGCTTTKNFFSERGVTAMLSIERRCLHVSVSRKYLLCLLDQRMLVPAACKSQTFWQVESPEHHSLAKLAALPEIHK